MAQNPQKKNKKIKVVLKKVGDMGGGMGGAMSADPRNRLWINILTSFLIFGAIIFLYTTINGSDKKVELIPLSQLAADIAAGSVEKITVESDNLKIAYKDKVEKSSKKEEGEALTQTLANYGLTPKQLSGVVIDVKTQSSLGFWTLNLAPIILSILFIVVFLWFMTRQVKGAGMQAFTFGQSKARVISPDDKKQRVTFKDVAGVKEAKEELK